MKERADFIEDEHLDFLDELRESGVTNMFGANPYLIRGFPDLTKVESGIILSYWMDTFRQRQATA